MVGFGRDGRCEGSIGLKSGGVCCRQGRETEKRRIWYGDRSSVCRIAGCAVAAVRRNVSIGASEISRLFVCPPCQRSEREAMTGPRRTQCCKRRRDSRLQRTKIRPLMRPLPLIPLRADIYATEIAPWSCTRKSPKEQSI